MDKGFWLVISAVSLIGMAMAIIIKDEQLTSTSLICCLICHAVMDLRQKK